MRLNQRFPRLSAGIALWFNLNNREGNSQANFVINQNLHMVGAVFLKLDAPEEMDIGGMGAQIAEAEGNFRLRNGLILFRIIDEAFLDEIAAAAAPTGPEAEFEETDRKGGGGNRAENADKSLLAADFCPDILAEEGGLQVGNDSRRGHQSMLGQLPEDGKGIAGESGFRKISRSRGLPSGRSRRIMEK